MTVHQPILLQRITDELTGPAERIRGLMERHQKLRWVDATLGGGGHTQALLEALDRLALPPNALSVLALDQDEGAVARGAQRFKSWIDRGMLELKHSRFSRIPECVQSGPATVGILADLGFSSDQIEAPERGLSFRQDGPLDMRLDPGGSITALSLLKTMGETELADIIFQYGEERASRKIARAIVSARQKGALPQTTTQFANLVASVFPPAQRHGRIHPATRTFQALRIAVNDELGELDALLSRGIMEVVPGGRVAILSFHSLEDRAVKRVLSSRADESLWEPLTKKPIEADEAEVEVNPRARSAKLRVSERKGLM